MKPSSIPFESQTRLKNIFSRLNHIKDLPEEIQAEIMAAAVLHHYNSGQIIYQEGEPARQIYILERGWVKATRITREGREQGLLFLRPVEIFGDIAAFTGAPYPGTATALEEVDAWAIPNQVMVAVVTRHPELAFAIIRRLSERVLHYINLVEDLSLRSVETRLAYSLLRNAEVRDGQMVVVRRKWATLDEMAVRLGTVRDVLSRGIKALEAEGFIRFEKQIIVILDPHGLTERSET